MQQTKYFNDVIMTSASVRKSGLLFEARVNVNADTCKSYVSYGKKSEYMDIKKCQLQQ